MRRLISNQNKTTRIRGLDHHGKVLLEQGQNLVTTVGMKFIQQELKMLGSVGSDLNLDKGCTKCTRPRGSCKFFDQYQLPCRHMLKTRILNEENLIEIAIVPQDYQLGRTLNPEERRKRTTDSVIFEMPAPKKAKASTDVF